MSLEGRAETTLPNPNQTDPSSDAMRASGPFEQSLHWDAPKLPVIRNVFPRPGRPWRSAMLVVTCYGVRAYVNRGPLPGHCEVEEPIVPMVNNSARRQRSNQRNARYGGTPLGYYLPLCPPNPQYGTAKPADTPQHQVLCQQYVTSPAVLYNASRIEPFSTAAVQ